MERYAIIMAGGAGARLWPLSRQNKPKQFISADGGKCMLVQTIERINKIVPPDKCFIITNKDFLDITQDTVNGLIPISNIILEPLRKNTAACIAYAAMLLNKKYGSGALCCIPADGYVKDEAGYRTALELSYSAAENSSSLVVIGITPTYPATGYGYIHMNTGALPLEKDVLQVLRFVEKPDIETAQSFIASNEYLWNGGIVTGKTDIMIDYIKLFLPGHFYKLSEALSHVNDEDFDSFLEHAYGEINDISFDNGVLEKSENLYVVRSTFDWDDIGSLDALSKTLGSDSMGNSVKGNYIGIETTNSVIYSDDGLIAAIGLDNMIIARTKDAVVVCPREKAQKIKSLVELLKPNGYGEYL